MPNRVGAVIWITGLSGAGKSTLGHLLWNALRDAGRPALYLDGDVLREMLGAVDSHGPDQRLALAHTYGRMCKVLAEQGATVVCSTISMFHAVRRWNRDHIPGYVEIYLKVPLDELIRRDPKGLYAKGVNMQGLDLPFEEPEAPDLVIDNFGATAPDQAVCRILDHLKGQSS